jgi:hypothetical protein
MMRGILKCIFLTTMAVVEDCLRLRRISAYRSAEACGLCVGDKNCVQTKASR